MQFTKPTLVTITAPTCSGKTYLIEHLAKLGFNRIVGFTTRAPRPGEVAGYDYYFVSRAEAEEWEREGLLAETAEFRGNRYGVTHAEMEGKLHGKFPPVVILEPSGLKSYEKYCIDHGYDIFKIYVTTQESLKIKRLNDRTVEDLENVAKNVKYNPDGRSEAIAKIIKTHTDRLLSITGEERTWQAMQVWDAVVPGDDVTKAINYIEQGIKWRNQKIAEAQANT